MKPSPLGWDEIFDSTKLDSVVPFLGVAQALAAQSKSVVDRVWARIDGS